MSEPTPEEIIEAINESGWNVRFLSPEVATGVYRVLVDLQDTRRTTLADVEVGDVVRLTGAPQVDFEVRTAAQCADGSQSPGLVVLHADYDAAYQMPPDTPCTIVDSEPDPADDPQAYLEERYGVERVKEDKLIHESFDWQFLVRFRTGCFCIYRNSGGVAGRLYYGRRYESRLKQGSLPDICDELEAHLKRQLDEDLEVLG